MHKLKPLQKIKINTRSILSQIKSLHLNSIKQIKTLRPCEEPTHCHFLKNKIEYCEHFVIATVSLLGILILFLFNDMVSLISLWIPVEKISVFLDKALFILFILFPAVTYWNAFKIHTQNQPV